VLVTERESMCTATSTFIKEFYDVVFDDDDEHLLVVVYKLHKSEQCSFVIEMQLVY